MSYDLSSPPNFGHKIITDLNQNLHDFDREQYILKKQIWLLVLSVARNELQTCRISGQRPKRVTCRAANSNMKIIHSGKKK